MVHCKFRFLNTGNLTMVYTRTVTCTNVNASNLTNALPHNNIMIISSVGCLGDICFVRVHTKPNNKLTSLNSPPYGTYLDMLH